MSFGRDALNNYSVEGADGRFMRSIKTFLPSSGFNGTYVFGKKYQLEDLIALILKTMKHRGEGQMGKEVDRVMMGHAP